MGIPAPRLWPDYRAIIYDPDMMRLLNIAHRGGAGLFPENTLAAFRNAVQLGCDGLELDAQLSADGVAIVHHDYRLNPEFTRLENRWLVPPSPRIKDLSLTAIQSYDVGMTRPGGKYAACHPQRRTAVGARIPTLREVLTLAEIAPSLMLLIELKCDFSDDSAEPTMLADAVLDVVGDKIGQVIFVGFDWRALFHVKKRSPGARCWFTTSSLQGDAKPTLEFLAGNGAAGWLAHFSDASTANTELAHQLGLKVGTWTVNDMTIIDRLGPVDAICTDRPDLLYALNLSDASARVAPTFRGSGDTLV